MRIDGKEIRVKPGTSVLAAARAAGIEIPGLCAAEGIEPYNACMLCLVELGPEGSHGGRLVPACTYPAERADEVSTASPKVRNATKRAVELLLTEHRGDCEAPCTRACPAGMDIPAVIRSIEEDDAESAITLAREAIVLPGVMGMICPAPCERACRRARYDESVSIHNLESYIAAVVSDADRAEFVRAPHALENHAAKSIAIVGAGPAGLSAASYIAGERHAVSVYDRGERPGGALLTGVTRDALPEEILAKDIECIRRRGVTFVNQCTAGADISIEELLAEHDAVLLTVEVSGCDKENPRIFHAHRVPAAASRQAIRAVARGRAAAQQILEAIAEVAPPAKQLDSRYGTFSDEEFARFVATSGSDQRRSEAVVTVQTAAEARREAKRCFRCDCAAKTSCRLREYATRYEVDLRGYRNTEKEPFARSVGPIGLVPASNANQSSGSDEVKTIIFESTKCVRCGTCVRIAESCGISPGLGFIGRSYGMKVLPPFGEDPGKALGLSAPRCIEACPTGALSYGRALYDNIAKDHTADGNEDTG